MLQRQLPPSAASFSTEAELLKKKRLPLEDAQRSSYAGTPSAAKYGDEDEDFVDVNATTAASATAASASSSSAAASYATEPETPNPEGRTRMSSLLNPRTPVILTSKPVFSSIHKKRNESESG
ncbi:hypothetical protein BASA81_013823 [Batrachochytrium salamandrivorans]|nr:hypothetical protein BASA81_013823 [Batrachochytrium salamandrivorans]